jgi:hypothetical protein
VGNAAADLELVLQKEGFPGWPNGYLPLLTFSIDAQGIQGTPVQ